MKPQLLLLHGALGSAALFDNLISHLATAYEVKAMDFPGHGGVSIPDSGISLEVLSHSLDNFIVNHFNTSNPIYILGYSMGGYLAIYSVLKGNTHISGIMTLATKFHWSPDIALLEGKMLNPEIMEAKVPLFAQELKKRHHPVDWKILMKNIALLLQELGDNNSLNLEAINTISIPIKIMLGDRDKMVSIEESIDCYKALIKGSFAILPNTAHSFEKVDLNRLVFEINDFILN